LGSKVGLAHEGQHLAGLGVDGHHRAAPIAEHVFDQLLQLDVHRQHHGVAGRGRVARQAAHGAPAGRGFHLLDAGLAVQRLLVALLDAELADVVGALVVGLVFLGPVFHRDLLALVDAPDVAEHVRGELALRVVAEQARLDLHARKAIALRREARHFFVAQARADRNGVEAARVFAQALEAAAVARRHLEHLGQAVDGFLDVVHLRGRDLQRVGRVVRGQHDAVAVEDEPPVGHHRHHRRAVALGLLGQVFVPRDLQVDEPRAQQAEGEQHGHADDDHAALEAREVGGDVADFGHGGASLGACKCEGKCREASA
jgi:hypothetical protein